MHSKIILILLIFSVIVNANGASILGRLLGVQSKEDTRISNGLIAYDGQFPSTVSIQKGFSHVCCGSILNKRWILTAAHCVYERDNLVSLYRVVTGFNVLKLATYAFIYAVEKFISHQDYNPKLVINDIALIKLKRDIVFSATVKPIALSQTFIEAEADLIAAGWGITSGNETHAAKTLMYVHAKSIDNKECGERVNEYSDITQKQICTFMDDEQGVCAGDSGGPLIDAKTKEQVGIVSWGVTTCYDSYPKVFTRTLAFTDWIQLNMS